MASTFGDHVVTDHRTRGMRLLEEACELAQALGVSRYAAINLLEKSFARPIGDVAQEIGGVSVTLLAVGVAAGVSVDACEVTELNRIHRPEIIEKARRREAENRQDGTA